MARFTGKVAIVTGAAQGIGAATAKRLAREGATVAVVDLDLDRCEAIVQSINDAGDEAAGFACDVTAEDQVDSTVAAILSTFGHLDILVNNAGISPGAPVAELSFDLWNRVMTVNAGGAFLFSRAFLRAVAEQVSGKIINVSSQSALGHPGRANYAASKAAIQGLTATLAAEAGRYNVNVNAVAPGYVVTAMTAATAAKAGLPHEEHQRQQALHTALGRVAMPGDIAAVIAFLASDDASYISGQTIYINGGPPIESLAGRSGIATLSAVRTG